MGAVFQGYVGSGIGGGPGANVLADLDDVVSAANTNRFALMANGTTGYVGRTLIQADISDIATIGQAEAEAGIAITDRLFTAQRVSQAIAALGGTGNVTKVGTPLNDQVGVWTGDGTLEGTAALTYNGARLFVVGDVEVSGNNRPMLRDISTGNVFPSILPVKGDLDTGIGAETASDDTVSVICGGIEAARFSEIAGSIFAQFFGQTLSNAGTTAAPSFSFNTDIDTGIFLADVNELGFSTGGVLKATLTAAGRLGIGTPTPNGPLEVVGPLPGIVGGHSSGNIQVRNTGTLVNDSASITGHNSFGGNKQLWFFGSISSSNDDVGLVNRENAKLSFFTNNTSRMEITGAGVVKPLITIENAVGTAALPSYSFTGDPDLGIFRVSADRIGISSNGALRWDVSANFITTTLNTRGPDSTALLPTYSFASDPDTGVFNVSADILGIAAGGVEGLRVTESAGVVSVDSPGALTALSYGGIMEANLLNKAATETINGTWTFDVAGIGITISSALPRLHLLETDAAADNKIWQFRAQGEQLSIGALNDAGTTFNSFVTVDRTGTTVGEVTILGSGFFANTTNIGFYTTTPIAKQTGVAVTAAGVHAALVALGLITA